MNAIASPVSLLLALNPLAPNSLAQTSLAQSDAQGGGLSSILILLLPLLLLVYVLIVPQRRQRKQQQQLLAKMAVGDEVLTNAGIYGVITHIEDGVLHLEVDNDVVIRVSQGAISRRTSDPDPTARAAKGGRADKGADTGAEK